LIVQSCLGFAAEGLPKLAHTLQTSRLETAYRQRHLLSSQIILQHFLWNRPIAQEHPHHFTEQTVLIFSRVRHARAWPSGDQIGKIHAYRRPCTPRGAVTAPFHVNLVATQIKVLPDVIEKQVDRRQGDRLRRKLIVRRSEADLYLLRERRRQISFEERLDRLVQCVDHAAPFLPVSSDKQRGQSSLRMSGLIIFASKSNQILLSFRQSYARHGTGRCSRMVQR